ncbi:MAG: hypothetical protein KGL58_06445, partial [Pseudomonadota bacterium]|nr:hypothetical protein [Pseudomonadota bacterium]
MKLKIITQCILALPFTLFSLPTIADESITASSLNKEIQNLQEQYNKERRNMQLLEIQIQQVQQKAQTLYPVASPKKNKTQ